MNFIRKMYTQRAVSTPEFPLVLRHDPARMSDVPDLPSFSDIDKMARKQSTSECPIPEEPSECDVPVVDTHEDVIIPHIPSSDKDTKKSDTEATVEDEDTPIVSDTTSTTPKDAHIPPEDTSVHPKKKERISRKAKKKAAKISKRKSKKLSKRKESTGKDILAVTTN